MNEDREKLARLRDEEDRETFAIHRLERAMTEEEHRLERRLDDLEADIERAEQTVDRDLRAQEFGQEPEHPPFWRADPARSRRRRHDDRGGGASGHRAAGSD